MTKPIAKLRDVKLCGARSHRGIASWSAPHKCRLPHGHTGKHWCGHQSEGTAAKPRKKPTPCNFRWGVQKATTTRSKK